MPGSRRNTPSGYQARRSSRQAGPEYAPTREDGVARSRSNRPTKNQGGSKVPVVIISVVIAIAVVAAVAYAAVSSSSLCTINRIAASGANHLTDSEIVQLANLPEGETLLRVDTEAIRQQFIKVSWVKDAQVRRVFPDTLEIVVTERQIKAVAEVPNSDASTNRLWALSEDGMWLMPVPDRDSEAGKLVSEQIYQDVENVLHIIDVPYGTQPEIGTYCTDANVNCAIAIVSGMTTSLADQVKTVKATDSASTTLILDSGVEIVFGSADDIRDKERVCLELLEKYGDDITYINVSVVDSPTCRHL